MMTALATNQANVMLENRPRIVHDGLYFRSTAEQYVHDYLIDRRIPFLPLPVVMRADGAKRKDGANRRIEPDFVLLYRGRAIVIELDGDGHQESPAGAERRVRFLREQGVIVHHLDAAACLSTDAARTAISELLKTIDREINTM